MPLSERQHEIRDRGIGSSDAASACDMNPWKSRVELWLEKTGRVEREDISDKEHIHFGNVLEEVVAKEFERRNPGRRVQRWATPYVRDFMVANVDRLIKGEGAILECKTTSAWGGKWEEVPEHYRLQVEHQLIAADKQEAVLAVLIGGNQYDQFELQRSKTLSEALLAKEKEFWEFVETDMPPPPRTAADVMALFPVDSGKVVVATAEIAEVHAELMAVRQEAKSIEELKKKLKEKMQLFIGKDAEVVIGQDGTKLATWKTSRGSDYCHWEKIATELKGLVPEEEYERVVAAHSGTYPHGNRVFLPKQLKRETENE